MRSVSTSEILTAIRPLQLAISEFSAKNKRMPADYADMGTGIDGTEATTCLGRIEQVTYTLDGVDGLITAIFYANGATQHVSCGAKVLQVPADLAAKTVVVRAKMNASGTVAYSIDGGTVESSYRPRF